MTESEPTNQEQGARSSEERVAQPSSDELAAKLLAVQRVLRALNADPGAADPGVADPDVRRKLHLRFMAICTSLKMPTADRIKGIQRLDRLMADAELARGARREGDVLQRPPRRETGGEHSPGT